MNIRKAIISDAPQIARVHVDSWKTTYKGLISDDYLENLSYKKREDNWRDRLEEQGKKIFTYVVESSERIVGFALGGLKQYKRDSKEIIDNPFEGELMAMYLLKEIQRRGIGRRLFFKVVEHLLNNNVRSMIVWVLKGNPASEFYKSLGGKYLGKRIVDIGGNNYTECSYTWEKKSWGNYQKHFYRDIS